MYICLFLSIELLKLFLDKIWYLVPRNDHATEARGQLHTRLLRLCLYICWAEDLENKCPVYDCKTRACGLSHSTSLPNRSSHFQLNKIYK